MLKTHVTPSQSVNYEWSDSASNFEIVISCLLLLKRDSTLKYLCAGCQYSEKKQSVSSTRKNRNNFKYSLQWVATVVIMVIKKIGDAWNRVVIVKAENLLLQVWLVYNEDKYFFRGHEVCWWNLKLICVKQWWEDNAIVAI